jgi:hypothetical protein
MPASTSAMLFLAIMTIANMIAGSRRKTQSPSWLSDRRFRDQDARSRRPDIAPLRYGRYISTGPSISMLIWRIRLRACGESRRRYRMMNAVEHREVTANRQNKAVRGVQDGRYMRKGSTTMSGKIENIRLYWAFCSASFVRRLEISDSCSVLQLRTVLPCEEGSTHYLLHPARLGKHQNPHPPTDI